MAESKSSTAKPLSKSQVYAALSEKTELTKKQIDSVFEALSALIKAQVGKKGPGSFVIPSSLIKVKRVVRPAKKARMGRNPATGEPMMLKAKSATTVIKAQAMKALKEMV
ncbi:MAG TPA: HU family DNA-binding protein [Gemmataceae bacterium]|nr:HU family DNA-binding protein [Gemmataceae bacterium]